MGRKYVIKLKGIDCYLKSTSGASSNFTFDHTKAKVFTESDKMDFVGKLRSGEYKPGKNGSHKNEDSTICATPQDRLTFRPSADDILEMMRHHMANEEHPIFSFGQGCEGEPLTEAPLLLEVVKRFREEGGHGTINLNSNASMPDAVAKLAEAGLSSLRVSLNSARPDVYLRYYRPTNYEFADVRRSITEASSRGVFVSLNLLYFPGITDCEEEIEALIEIINTCGVNFIQLRNLNIDPELYMDLMDGIEFGPSVGLVNFRKRLKKYCPGLKFGYFNPYVTDEESAAQADEASFDPDAEFDEANSADFDAPEGDAPEKGE